MRGRSIYSQSGQDVFVLSYFNRKLNGVFVDVGANDGVSFSNTYYLEKKLKWTGICFEPNPVAFKKLDESRNCIKINACVADVKTVEKFMLIEGYSHMLSGIIKEFSPQHIIRIEKEVKEHNQKVREIDVLCVVLNDVLEEHKIFNIDYLSIDTEGNEFKILKSIDFGRFNIELMTVENNYNDKEQTNFVISNGYQFIGKLDADEIFVKVKR
jgi:FkbM family methyltransferase